MLLILMIRHTTFSFVKFDCLNCVFIEGVGWLTKIISTINIIIIVILVLTHSIIQTIAFLTVVFALEVTFIIV